MESHKANGALHYARAKELQATVPPSVAPVQEEDVSAVMSTEEQSAQVSSASAGFSARRLCSGVRYIQRCACRLLLPANCTAVTAMPCAFSFPCKGCCGVNRRAWRCISST